MYKFFLWASFLIFASAPAIAAANVGVTLETKPAAADGVMVITHSKYFSYYTVTVNVVGENIAASSPLPVTVDSDGKRSMCVVWLHPKDPSKAWKYTVNWNWFGGGRARGAVAPFVYSLPYAGAQYKVAQGYGGSFSHFPGSQYEYAIDWGMAVGTVVRCARDGEVVGVLQDSDRGGADPSFTNDVNYVLVRHADGTFGEYDHLKQNGALVKLGQRVTVGQPIGLSGNTGWSAGPHLHFDVFNTVDGLKKVTMPVVFKTGTGEIVTPQLGQEYAGAAIPATLPNPSLNPDIDLWKAVGKGDLAKAKAALDAGANPDYSLGANPAVETTDRPVLFDACNRGDSAMIALLRARGANVNIRDWSGASPLAALKPNASLTTIKTLLDLGADPEAAGTDMTTALIRFCVLDRRDAAALLLAHGAKADTAGLMGLTPIVAATTVKDVALLQLLASHGADLRRPLDGGVTALHIAVMKEGNAPVLLFLIQHGLNVNRKTDEGDTPLTVAVASGCLENVKFLLAHGADVHTLAVDGETLIASTHGAKNAKPIVAALKAAGEKS